MKVTSYLLPALLSISATAPLHAAQSDANKPSGFFVLGAGTLPDYEGSNDYGYIPFISGSVSYKGYDLSLAGPTFNLNVSNNDAIKYGPSLSYSFGRDDDVDSAAVSRMTEIDGTLEVGAFVSFPFKEILMPHDSFSVDFDVLTDTGNAHKGTLLNAGTSYKYFLNKALQLGASLSTTYADSNYTQTYFGVDAIDASLSGLPEYEASAGFKNINLVFNSLIRLSETHGISGILRYTRLIGDVADSPLVAQEGSENQVFFGIGYFQTF